MDHEDFAPGTQVPVVRLNPQTGQRELVHLRWGLVPSWAKDAGTGNQFTHARSETIATKPAFKEAFRQRRCLIVVDKFDVGRRKTIRMKDTRPFGVGGVWERWQQGEEVIESCAIITTASNDLVRPINSRMPVIIAAEDYGRWLDAKFSNAEELQRMMESYPDEDMVVESARKEI